MKTLMSVFALVSFAAAAEPVFELQQSVDGMQTWQKVFIHKGMLTVDGKLAPGGMGESSAYYRMRIRMLPPSGMALIRSTIFGTSFEMGDVLNDLKHEEHPVHTVTLSPFYIGRTEVTKAQWDEVAGWAENNGYDISPSGGYGKGPDHPVCEMSWWECVKFANAKSEIEGYAPVYTVDGGAPFRTGTKVPDVNPNTMGYRLPTEAEWECAARGGMGGVRFPCGMTISHSQANYDSSEFEGIERPEYDVSSTLGYHPDYDDGSAPRTSPVGSFPPNGYGLYDMVGNVTEWCGDWYAWDYYSTSPTLNPPGPSSGSQRVLRGGSWDSIARFSRVACRGRIGPGSFFLSYGFRLARTAE